MLFIFLFEGKILHFHFYRNFTSTFTFKLSQKRRFFFFIAKKSKWRCVMSIYYPCPTRYYNHMANLSTQPFLFRRRITFDLINFVNGKTRQRKNNGIGPFQTGFVTVTEGRWEVIKHRQSSFIQVPKLLTICRSKIMFKKSMKLYRCWPLILSNTVRVRGQFHRRITSSFYACWSQKCKNCLFALLLSACTKAARKMLVKSTLGR